MSVLGGIEEYSAIFVIRPGGYLATFFGENRLAKRLAS